MFALQDLTPTLRSSAGFAAIRKEKNMDDMDIVPLGKVSEQTKKKDLAFGDDPRKLPI